MITLSQYYIYLISSLPMLQFGMKPPFSFEQLLKICAEKISEDDINILKTASLGGEYVHEDIQLSTLKRWRWFDTGLRNELVKIRAARKHIDPAKYLRQDEYTDQSIAQIAINAYRNPSVLEAERMLDEARWRMLDELTLGHYFDIDFLVVYAHKLLILERWEKIRTADSSRILEEALQ